MHYFSYHSELCLHFTVSFVISIFNFPKYVFKKYILKNTLLLLDALLCIFESLSRTNIEVIKAGATFYRTLILAKPQVLDEICDNKLGCIFCCCCFTEHHQIPENVTIAVL